MAFETRLRLPLDTDIVYVDDPITKDPHPLRGKVTQWWADALNQFGFSPTLLEGLHADRPDAEENHNSLYTELDRQVTYQSLRASGIVTTAGTALSWISGMFFRSSWVGRKIIINGVSYGVAAVASAVTATLSSSAGVQTGVAYSQADYGWVYAYGRMAFDINIQNQPTDLSFIDTDFRIYSQEYRHEWRWNGSVWIFSPGDPGSKYIVEALDVAPQGGLWQLCDGTAVNVAQNDATLASVTTPDCTGDIFILGGTYTGSRKAAARATWEAAARTADESAHTHTIPGESVTPGPDPAVIVGQDGASGAGTAHSHALTDALSQLRVPSEVNGGVPLRMNLARYLRR